MGEALRKRGACRRGDSNEAHPAGEVEKKAMSCAFVDLASSDVERSGCRSADHPGNAPRRRSLVPIWPRPADRYRAL
jgi:hypothetical protein